MGHSLVQPWRHSPECTPRCPRSLWHSFKPTICKVHGFAVPWWRKLCRCLERVDSRGPKYHLRNIALSMAQQIHCYKILLFREWCSFFDWFWMYFCSLVSWLFFRCSRGRLSWLCTHLVASAHAERAPPTLLVFLNWDDDPSWPTCSTLLAQKSDQWVSNDT